MASWVMGHGPWAWPTFEYMIASEHVYNFSLAIWLLFSTPPPLTKSIFVFSRRETLSFILIRAAPKLGSDEKSV